MSIILLFVAGPATHGGKETLTSAIYSWEKDTACLGTIQQISAAKQLTNHEHAMPENIAKLGSKNRQERVAAFKQIQAISHQLSLQAQC